MNNTNLKIQCYNQRDNKMTDEEFYDLWQGCVWRQEIDRLRRENKRLEDAVDELKVSLNKEHIYCDNHKGVQ